VNLLITLARQAGVGRTFGDGENAWSTVHIDDLGDLYALALEKAPAGSVLHAVAGEPIAMREIVAAISQTLGYGGRIEAWAIEEAHQQYGDLADSIASEKRLSAERTKALLGWTPEAPSIIRSLSMGLMYL
jgi:nucleoside-diphosphate-sugar epimerase